MMMMMDLFVCVLGDDLGHDPNLELFMVDHPRPHYEH